jgi:hypothetical protein
MPEDGSRNGFRNVVLINEWKRLKKISLCQGVGFLIVNWK